MRFFVPLVFLSAALGLHLSNRPGALWVLPYTETLARRLNNPTGVGPTTLEEQILAADITVGILAAIGVVLFGLSLLQSFRSR